MFEALQKKRKKEGAASKQFSIEQARIFLLKALSGICIVKYVNILYKCYLRNVCVYGREFFFRIKCALHEVNTLITALQNFFLR